MRVYLKGNYLSHYSGKLYGERMRERKNGAERTRKEVSFGYKKRRKKIVGTDSVSSPSNIGY